VVSSLAPWRTPGFTRAPSRDPLHRIVPSLIGQAPDTLEGKFCRFPPAAEATGHGRDSTIVTREPDGVTLALEGQSQLAKPASAAICTGTTVPRLP
jgi:hypothetical protein